MTKLYNQAATELIIAKSITKEEEDIIREYWAMNDGEFLHKASVVQKKHNIKSKFISERSHMKICRMCETCKEPAITASVSSQSAFLQFARSKYYPKQCDGCQEAAQLQEKNAREEKAKNRALLFATAVEQKKWTTLDEAALRMLKGIVAHKFKSAIYHHVFEGKTHDKAMWNIAGRICEAGLLVVERKDDLPYGPVLAFHFPAELEILLNAAPRQKTQLVYTPSYTFTLSQNLYRRHARQPQFSGRFKLGKDIFIRSDVNYNITGHEQTDKNIQLIIQPETMIPIQAGDRFANEAHLRFILYGRSADMPDTDPDYFSCQRFPYPVRLIADISYSIGGWLKDDNQVDVVIRPYDPPEKGTPGGTTSHPPVTINDLLRNLGTEENDPYA